MIRENFQIKRILCYFFYLSLCILSISCEGGYTIQGNVFAINGEPLPGVCVSSPEIFKYVITNTKGNFVFCISKPINKLEFMKSDYLPYTVSLSFTDRKNITLQSIILTPKPSTPGVYFLNKEKNNYIPLIKGKIEKTEIEKQNSIPSVKLNEITTIKKTSPSIYIFRLPQYDVTLYQMKEYIPNNKYGDKSKDKTDKPSVRESLKEEKEKKIWVPDKPILTHAEFLSEIDTSLFVLRPIDELKSGIYCVNWRAFEVPFPRMNDCFLFSIEEEQKIDDIHNESTPSENSNEEGDTKKVKDDKKVKN